MKIKTKCGEVIDLAALRARLNAMWEDQRYYEPAEPLLDALEAALSVRKPEETTKNAQCLRWYECALEDVAAAAGVVKE